VARKKVINKGQNQDLIGGNFTNVASETVFSLGDFVVKSNFTGKKTRDYSNTLSSFSNPITLETLGIDNNQSQDIFDFTNTVTLNFDKSDIKSYVRFGSAAELFRVTIDEIIKNYPASIYLDSQGNGTDTFYNFTYDPFTDTSNFRMLSSVVSNTFTIIFDNGNLSNPIDNKLRNLNLSYENFVIWQSTDPENNTHNVLGFTGDTVNTPWIELTVQGNPFPTLSGATTGSVNFHMKPNVLEYNKFLKNSNQLETYFISNRLADYSGFQIKLKKVTILDTGGVFYGDVNILWNTTDNYNPNIQGSLFETFLTTILSIGTSYDKVKTDLIARFLTPASLKLYDLTDEGKMTKLLRIYGREFDELRLFIDAIVNINKTTYDKKNNIPDILVRNLAKTMGWDVFDLVTEQDVTEAFFSSEKEFGENDLLPAEIDIELWRRILINTNYYWKSKGTRHAIKSMFQLIGIPEPFINITEYVYTVDGKINPNDVELSLEDIPSASFPFDGDGYPIAPVETDDFYFQISGNSDNGQAYIDNFRNMGFDVNRTIDNKKSWVEGGFIERIHPSTPNYYQEDSKLIINTKEVDVTLDTARGIEYDVFCYNKFIDSPITSTGTTSPYIYINMELEVDDPTTFNLPEIPMSGSAIQMNYNGVTLTPTTDYNFDNNLGTVTINPATAVSATTGQDVITVTYLYNRLGNTGYTQVEYLVQAPTVLSAGAVLQLPEEPKGDVQLVINGITMTKGTTLFSGDFMIDTLDRTKLIIQNNDLKAYLLTNPVIRTWYIKDGSLPSNAEKRSEAFRVDSFSSSKFYYNAGINKYIYVLDFTAFNLDSIKITVNGITLQNGTDFTLNPLNKKQVYLPSSINLGFIIGAYYIIDDGSYVPPLLPVDSTFPDIGDMSFLEYLELITRRLINVPRRKTITDNTGGYYPTVQHIYDEYLKRSFLPNGNPLQSNGYNFGNLYSFINQYNAFFNRFVNELLPATIILGKGGILIRNTAFTRQKFRYPRGVNFDSNLEYLGDDGSTFIVVQPQTTYEWSINLICVSTITSTNARRHELKCNELQPSGNSTIVTTNIYYINDTFSSYSAISLTSLGGLSDSAYATRVSDFLIYIGVSTQLERDNLLLLSTFDTPACVQITTTTTTTTTAPTTTTIAPTTTTTTTTTAAPTTTFGFINGDTSNTFSNDGGETWTLDDPNIGSYGVIAVNTNTIVAVRTSDGLINGVDSHVRRSTDAGATWTEPTFGTALSFNESFGVMSTKDVNNIYVGNISSSHVWFLYKSTDGGATFNRTTTDIPFTGFGGVIAVDALGDLVVAQFNQPLGMFISNDGGATWVDRTSLYAPTTQVTSPAISIGDSNTIYSTQVDLKKSTDGGATWFDVTVPFFTRSIYFANADLGIISSYTNDPASVAITNDGGDTWTIHELPIGIDPEINQAGRPYILDENTWWATTYNLSSQKQWLYKTFDGGVLIEREEIPYSINNNITFI